jgi:hypothetical protein
MTEVCISQIKNIFLFEQCCYELTDQALWGAFFFDEKMEIKSANFIYYELHKLCYANEYIGSP